MAASTFLSDVAHWHFTAFAWEDGPTLLTANAATRVRVEFSVENISAETLDFADSWSWDPGNRSIVDVASASRGRVTVEYAPPDAGGGPPGSIPRSDSGTSRVALRGGRQRLRWGSYQLAPSEVATLTLLLLILPTDENVGKPKVILSGGVVTARGLGSGLFYADWLGPLDSSAFDELENGGIVDPAPP